jgi:hypothetical protein
MLDKQKIILDLFQAYYDARKNKRNTLNQLDFEFNLESNLINLWEELINDKYEVWRSIYFIQNHPVKREVFAWSFRDRVVHHLIYNYISLIFEKEFIYDSYSCRIWKWTSFGIKRVNRFIRSCSENYTKDAYVLKLDISGYFMSINKDILFEKIEKVLKNNKIQWIFPSSREWQNINPGWQTKKEFYDFLLNLIYKVIYNDCTKNSIFKWKREDYIWLPKNKSLFFGKPNCWLPIWNLTSQLFSNIYLSDFDKFVKQELSPDTIKSGLFYWRYVDDLIIINQDKDFLVWVIEKIKNHLNDKLWLTLHPDKIYLQHYSKWVLFLWSYIKPYRNYIRKRTVWYFYWKVQQLNTELKNNDFNLDDKISRDFLSIINSYLGMMGHYKSYKIRKKILLNQVSVYFWKYFYVSDWFGKAGKKKNDMMWKLEKAENDLFKKREECKKKKK